MVCPKLGKYHTVNFKTKNYEQIFIETLQDSIKEGLISDDENLINYINNKEDIENQYVLQASIHSKQLEKCYDEIQNIYDAQDINKAKGEDLNRIGEQLGFKRPTATHSYTDLTFTLNQKANKTITIPKNTLISTRKNGGKNYRTNTRGKIQKGNNTITIPATSIDYGHKSRVEAGELKHIQHKIENIEENNTITVTNENSSTGGTNHITDNEYRDILKQWNTILEKGTKDAYTFYLDNVQGLESYNIIPLWDGAGTIKIVISPNSQYLVDIIHNDLYQNVQLFDDDVLIVGALEQPVDISLNVNITLDTNREFTTNEFDNLKTEITELTKYYIEGGLVCEGDYVEGLGIGEDFIPYQLGRFLNDRLSIIQNITFEDNTPITVNDESKATLGTVNINIE